MVRTVLFICAAIWCLCIAVGELLIFGGEKVNRNINYKFVVSVHIDNYPMCGGSLITFDTVLSVAHCFEKYISGDYLLEQYSVLAGTASVIEHGARRNVSKVVIHEKYAPSMFNDDICLIKLSSPFHKNNKVDVIEIAPKGFAWPAGETGLIYGWGRTEHNSYPDYLLYTNITLFSKHDCLQLMSAERDIIDENMQCAGEVQGGIDACDGDSGGGLVHLKTFYLIGIVSWGELCGVANKSGIYTEVAAYNDWINEYVDLKLQQ